MGSSDPAANVFVGFNICYVNRMQHSFQNHDFIMLTLDGQRVKLLGYETTFSLLGVNNKITKGTQEIEKLTNFPSISSCEDDEVFAVSDGQDVSVWKLPSNLKR